MNIELSATKYVIYLNNLLTDILLKLFFDIPGKKSLNTIFFS